MDTRKQPECRSDGLLETDYCDPQCGSRRESIDESGPGVAAVAADAPFGEYPCGHCIGAAVAAGLIEPEFGPDARLTFLDSTMPGAGRTVTPREYVREVSMSRIYAGVHYRFSNEAAEEMGRRIARLAVQRYMRRRVRNSSRILRVSGGRPARRETD